MKRTCLSFITALFLLLVVPNLAGAASSETGLLDGKTMSVGSYITNKLGTTTLVTDNNQETYYALTYERSDKTIADSIFYTFSESVSINAYKLEIQNYSTGNICLAFFDSSNNLIKLFTLTDIPTDSGIYELPEPVSGVNTVNLYQQTGETLNIAEINLYSDVPLTTPNLTATTDNDNDQISLSWDTVADATYYNVQRSTTPGGPYTTIATGVTDTSYTDANVEAGVTFYYVVTAANDAGESEVSNEVSATLTEDVVTEPTPEPTPDSDRAILTIYLLGGTEKEYDLSMDEVNDFIDWYVAKDARSGSAIYTFDKDWNVGPFTQRTEYVIFDKILTFNVDEYEA